MTTSPAHSDFAHGASGAISTVRSDTELLRAVVVFAGIAWSVAFVVIGLRYELQLYGDGAMFSYSVAVQDAWAFHWHNIAGRSTVYLLSLLPAEAYVALSSDPIGGIVVYGFLFFVAPLLGLIATFAVDRSDGRIIFSYACFSTACLCPLVFGFPTEMWMAHALFWPALAAAHYARDSVLGTVLVFALMLALVLTHEGAFILAIAIVANLALRGLRDRAFLRVAAALFVATVIWAAVKLVLPPGAYFSAVYVRAALHFFDIRTLTGELVLLLAGAIVGYGILFLALMRFTPLRAHLYATLIVAGALVIYWLRLDHTIHAGDRYYLRTALVIATPILGMLAALHAGGGASRLTLPSPLHSYVTATITRRALARVIVGGFLLVMLVHTVETAKFVTVWANYKSAVLTLAKGNASDPALGNPLFVSSSRIGPELNRLSWFSTTQYLSVIVAKFAPARLVVDPTGNYFWFPCKTATANLRPHRAVPIESRRLVRTYACLHR